MATEALTAAHAEIVEKVVEEIDVFLADYLKSRSDLIKHGLIPVDRVRFGLVARIRKNVTSSAIAAAGEKE